MNDEQVLELIQEALHETVDGRVAARFGPVSLDMQIRELGIDSILVMEMVGAIEDRLARTFREDELAKARTLRDLASLIRTGRVGV
jgi:acyl carrier protein